MDWETPFDTYDANNTKRVEDWDGYAALVESERISLEKPHGVAYTDDEPESPFDYPWHTRSTAKHRKTWRG